MPRRPSSEPACRPCIRSGFGSGGLGLGVLRVEGLWVGGHFSIRALGLEGFQFSKFIARSGDDFELRARGV